MTVAGSNEELTDMLRKTPDILRALVADIGEEGAHTRDAGGWSMVEVIGHLIDAERRAIDRIDQLQRQDNPVLAGYDQTGLVERQEYQKRDLAGVLAEFSDLRDRRVAILESLDESGWKRQATFASYGEVTLREITMHMCWHDVNHLAQIARTGHGG